MIYLDTGCLLKLYHLEAKSAEVVRVTAGEKIIFTGLHGLEITSALRLKCFRGEASEQQINAAIHAVQLDLAVGRLVLSQVDWASAWESATMLAQNYSAATGCRSLDLLHCALARATQATRFISSDRRQIAVATRMGLPVFAI